MLRQIFGWIMILGFIGVLVGFLAIALSIDDENQSRTPKPRRSVLDSKAHKPGPAFIFGIGFFGGLGCLAIGTPVWLVAVLLTPKKEKRKLIQAELVEEEVYAKIVTPTTSEPPPHEHP